MGVAYYIELDNDDLDVNNIDGKAVAKAMDNLNALAKSIGVTPLEDFMGQSMDDICDMLGEDIKEYGVDGVASWFEPKEGIAVLERLIGELRTNPQQVKAATAVIEDLESYVAALRTAEECGAKWHLAIDI